jgi:hypothetical protein
MARGAEDRTYTDLKAPTAWRAPETFVSRAAGKVGSVASTASDVFMLGCCFLELATGCTRTPYDWLPGESLLVYRGHDSTRAIGPIQVTLLLLIVGVVAAPASAVGFVLWTFLASLTYVCPLVCYVASCLVCPTARRPWTRASRTCGPSTRL